MAVINTVFYLLFVSAGIGFIITIIIDAINDALLRRGWSVVKLDTLLHPLFRTRGSIAKEKEGFAELLIAGWFLTLGFLVLWIASFFTGFTNSVIVAALTYAFCTYLVIMLVLLPVVHLGFFGLHYNKRVPLSAAIILLLYAFILSFLITLIV